MTTIAYKDGVLAADTQSTYGNLRCKCPDKIFVDGQRNLYGIFGNEAECLRFVAELREWEGDSRSVIADYPKLECDDESDESGIVRVRYDFGETSRFIVEVYEPPGWPTEVHEKFFAWGTGAELAMGAMAMGASPRQAVEVAAAWDAHTGFDVVELKVDGSK